MVGVCAVCGPIPPQPSDQGVSRAPSGRQLTGLHFGAVTCLPCRQFFRRAKNSRQLPSCRRRGLCAVDATAEPEAWAALGRHCPGCRLNKCFRVGMDLKKVLGEEQKKKRFPKTQKKSQEQKEALSQPISPSSPSKSDQNQHVPPSCSHPAAFPHTTSPLHSHQLHPLEGERPDHARTSPRPLHGAHPVIHPHRLPGCKKSPCLSPNEHFSDNTSSLNLSQSFPNQLVTDSSSRNQTVPQVSPNQRVSVIENRFIKGSNITSESLFSSANLATSPQTENDNRFFSSPRPVNSAQSSLHQLRANSSTESRPAPQKIQRVSVIKRTLLTNKKTMAPSTSHSDFLESNHQMVKKYWYQKHLLSSASRTCEIMMSPKLEGFGMGTFHGALSDENECDLENIVIENNAQFIRKSDVLEHIYNTYLFDDLSVPFMEERKDKFLAYWHGVNFGEEVIRSNIEFCRTRAAVPVSWVKMGHYVFRQRYLQAAISTDIIKDVPEHAILRVLGDRLHLTNALPWTVTINNRSAADEHKFIYGYQDILQWKVGQHKTEFYQKNNLGRRPGG